ncbi:hypothetical protein STAS_18372 [Striga asiatica]|uniref:Uncharacterized protein n=1 Tax=Striga asiatica TaxID=4170 RepID=A0A5A7Q8W3_STRAF|nr:hypothetical protein STAS_18372 [Striga asiatica]
MGMITERQPFEHRREPKSGVIQHQPRVDPLRRRQLTLRHHRQVNRADPPLSDYPPVVEPVGGRVHLRQRVRRRRDPGGRYSILFLRFRRSLAPAEDEKDGGENQSSCRENCQNDVKKKKKKKKKKRRKEEEIEEDEMKTCKIKEKEKKK